MNAGGVITRTVRGLPDDIASIGYYDSLTRLEEVWCTLDNPQNGLAYIQDVLGKQVDPEPDQFFFNFGGQSGKFVMACHFPRA